MRLPIVMKQNADAVQCNTTRKIPNTSHSHNGLFLIISSAGCY